MGEEEAVALVAKAIRAGIFNDLGSGSNVDVCIIRKDGVDYRRNMEFLQVGGGHLLEFAEPVSCMSSSGLPSHIDAPETGVLQSLLERCCAAWQDKTYSRAKPVQHAPGTAGRFAGLLQPALTKGLALRRAACSNWMLASTSSAVTMCLAGPLSADVIREKVHNVIKLDAVEIIAGEPADAMDTTA